MRRLAGMVLPSLTALLAINVVLAATAHADSGQPAIRAPRTLVHGYFDYSAAPGTVLRDAFIATNTGSAGACFNTYASDGETSPDTGVVYAAQDDPFPDGPAGNGQWGAGRWLTLALRQICLGPGDSTTVPFTVSVPPSAQPGDWVGSVEVDDPAPQNQGPAPTGKSARLSVTIRAAMAVVVHVPGPTSDGPFSVGQPQLVVLAGSRQAIDFPLGYDGNRLDKPYFRATVSDPENGHVYLIFDTATWPGGTFDTFLPHSHIHYDWNLSSPLPVGTYTISTLFGDRTKPQAATYSLRVSSADTNLPFASPKPGPGFVPPLEPVLITPAWLVPVLAAAGGMVVILAAALGLLFRSVRRQRREATSAAEGVSAGRHR